MVSIRISIAPKDFFLQKVFEMSLFRNGELVSMTVLVSPKVPEPVGFSPCRLESSFFFLKNRLICTFDSPGISRLDDYLDMLQCSNTK